MPDIAVVGPWAKEKLEALERYLDFYTKVLKNQRWRTIYVDAFAGGGRALVRADSAQVDESIPLFEPEPASDVDRSPRWPSWAQPSLRAPRRFATTASRPS